MVLPNIGHICFNMVYSKHRYHKCLLMKLHRQHRIVFTFHENLLDEKVARNERNISVLLKPKTFGYL